MSFNGSKCKREPRLKKFQELTALHSLIGEDQLAELLDISTKTLRKWIKDENIPKEMILGARLEQIFEKFAAERMSVR